MSKKTPSDWLNEYARQRDRINLAGIAIEMAEGMPGDGERADARTRNITQALREIQQAALPKLDAAAAALGAPYPRSV